MSYAWLFKWLISQRRLVICWLFKYFKSALKSCEENKEIVISVLLVFVFWSVFLTKLLSLGILFSTAVRTVVVAKLVILGISNLASFV